MIYHKMNIHIILIHVKKQNMISIHKAAPSQFLLPIALSLSNRQPGIDVITSSFPSTTYACILNTMPQCIFPHYINGIKQHLFFCVRFLLSTLSLCDLFLCVCSCGFFIVITEQYSIVLIYHNGLTIDTYLSGFQMLCMPLLRCSYNFSLSFHYFKY